MFSYLPVFANSSFVADMSIIGTSVYDVVSSCSIYTKIGLVLYYVGVVFTLSLLFPMNPIFKNDEDDVVADYSTLAVEEEVQVEDSEEDEEDNQKCDEEVRVLIYSLRNRNVYSR